MRSGTKPVQLLPFRRRKREDRSILDEMERESRRLAAKSAGTERIYEDFQSAAPAAVVAGGHPPA